MAQTKSRNTEEIILEILKTAGKPLSSLEIAKESKFSARTVRYILKKLQRKGLVKKIPDLLDMRRCFYKLTS